MIVNNRIKGSAGAGLPLDDVAPVTSDSVLTMLEFRVEKSRSWKDLKWGWGVRGGRKQDID